MPAKRLTIVVDDDTRVSALLDKPAKPRAGYVIAHGAGAGMTHPFLTAVAQGLGERGIATFRYQFPYMEAHKKRVDSPAVAEATVRAAVVDAARRLPNVPLIAGGKSFGGRMTSQAQANTPLPGVRGLAFLGFPLHAPGNHRWRGPITSRRSQSRCSSCRERATTSPISNCFVRW